jgi:biotin carboxylase
MNQDKTLLIINLRDDAIERIVPFETAKRLGLQVVFLGDRDPSLPAGLIHHMLITDTYDMSATLQALDAFLKERGLKIDGVTTWADRDVELVAKVGQHFDVPALHPDAAKKVRNKYFLREALSVADDLSPRYRSVTNEEEFWAAVKDIGYPCVFKPTGVSASTGIFVLNDDGEATTAFQTMIKVSDPSVNRAFSYYPRHYIVEEYLDGPEFSVEGIVHHGVLFIAAVTDKWTTEPYKLEVQHILPSGHPEHVVAEIKAKARRVVEILGLDHCPIHLECKYTSRGVRVIEIAGRPGGDNIASHLIVLATGLDFHEQIIRNAVGLPVRFDQPLSLYAGLRKFVAETDGTVVSVALPDQMPAEVLHYNVWVKEGDTILLPPKHFSKQLMGYVVVNGASYAEVDAKLQRCANLVRITVAEDPQA